MDSKPDLSIVTSAYNEGKNIELFICEVRDKVHEFNPQINCELIIVDDGSADDTWMNMLRTSDTILTGKDTNFRIKCIKLISNYGQMQALEAGLRYSNGNFILTMDSDLQMPASQIPIFWKARQKHAIVAGQQIERKDHRIKSALSQYFYLFLRKKSNYKITPNGGDFRLYPRQFVDEILKINSNFKVYRFLAPKLRFPIIPLRFVPEERLHGKSSYSMSKMVNLAKNSLLSLSIAPTKLIAIYFGAFFLFFIGICIYAFYSFATREIIPGWTSISISISLGFLGVLGCLYIVIEYLIKIYENSQAFPSYIIEQISSFE